MNGSVTLYKKSIYLCERKKTQVIHILTFSAALKLNTAVLELRQKLTRNTREPLVFGIRCNRHQLLSSISELWLQKIINKNINIFCLSHTKLLFFLSSKWTWQTVNFEFKCIWGEKKGRWDKAKERERSMSVTACPYIHVPQTPTLRDLICTAESAFKALSTCPRAPERAGFTCTTSMKNDRNLHKTLPDVSRITGVYSINSIFNNSRRSLAWMHFILFVFYFFKGNKGKDLAWQLSLCSYRFITERRFNCFRFKDFYHFRLRIRDRNGVEQLDMLFQLHLMRCGGL